MGAEESKSIIHWINNNILSRAFVSIIGLIAAVITIYVFLKEKQVNLEYQITSNTNVLDINADLSKLDIVYDSTSLKKSHENLKIVSIKILNNGNQDILKTFFDSNSPVGIGIKNGQVIEKPEIIDASNDYLRQNFRINYDYPDSLTFSSIIIEQNQFVILKLSILHDLDSIPSWFSFGKIAGQQKISIIPYSADIANDSFLMRAFTGSLLIQLFRAFAYFVVFVFMIGTVAIIGSALSSLSEKRKRKGHLKEFLKFHQKNRMDDAIFDRYLREGQFHFSLIQFLLNDEERLNNIYSLAKSGSNKGPANNNSKVINNWHLSERLNSDLSMINSLIDDGLIIKTNDSIIPNYAIKVTLDSLIEFLSTKGIKTKTDDYSSISKVEREKYPPMNIS